MSFEVLKPGMLSLIQDAGRYGYQHLGVTTGGPMDEHAFAWANRILGNRPGSSMLEITFGMLSLRVKSPTTIAITGADLGARINKQPVSTWRSYTVTEGDRIDFETPLNGLRCYLAVVGGFTLEPKLNSCSTVVREGLGGIVGDGSKLVAGQRIPFVSSTKSILEKVPEWAIPDYSQPLKLGVMLGYQYLSYRHRELAKLFSSDYVVSQHIDRMGYRLSGQPVVPDIGGIVSEGIAFGAIQIPGDGQPIVMMKDRQTIGGYPKVGCLSSFGAGQLAQRSPGTSISFYPMEVSEAEGQRMIFNHLFGH